MYEEHSLREEDRVRLIGFWNDIAAAFQRDGKRVGQGGKLTICDRFVIADYPSYRPHLGYHSSGFMQEFHGEGWTLQVETFSEQTGSTVCALTGDRESFEKDMMLVRMVAS